MLFIINLDKRYQEKPMRTWTIWGLDASKLVVAQFTQHMFNCIVSTKIGQSVSLECEWYMIQIISDCSIGVLIQYLYLYSLTNALKDTDYRINSGDYIGDDDQISFKKYIYQLFLWILIVIIVHLINI